MTTCRCELCQRLAQAEAGRVGGGAAMQKYKGWSSDDPRGRTHIAAKLQGVGAVAISGGKTDDSATVMNPPPTIHTLFFHGRGGSR